MASTLSIDSTQPLASPSSSAPGSSKDLKNPFTIRSELLTSTRLAPKAQLLLYSRSLCIQVIAHEVFLVVMTCAKCFAIADKPPPRIGILGGGSVGTTLVMTLLANGFRAERMALSTRQPDRIPRCEALKPPSALPMFQLVPRYYDNARLARENDILVLCIPPSQLKSVAIQIRHALAANVNAPPLVISVLCGVTYQSLTKACGSQAVVRVQPDVEKIASQWHEQQQQNENEEETNCTLPSRLDSNAGERNWQPLPLRLAVEAIAPQRRDVRDLLHAFALFGRRAWSQDVSVRVVARVLFGDKSEVATAALGQVAVEIGEQQQQEFDNVRARTPTAAPFDWEQDLIELQTHLATNALLSS